MNASGGLFLLLAIGVIVIVGLNAVSALDSEATGSNNTETVHAATVAEPIASAIFTVLGCLAMLVGAIAVISAYRMM